MLMKKMYLCIYYCSAMRNVVAFCLLLSVTAFCVRAQVCGCTDPMALNYNGKAMVNDGTCKYAHSVIKAEVLGKLDPLIQGTSSLLYWNNNYWTYNDHNDNCLYRIDSTNAATAETLCMNKIRNFDTEEISQDDQYLYFGDIGNNSGKRKGLQILRIRKDAIRNKVYKVDTIRFSYEDQTDFTARPHATNFDCEAFIVTKDSIFLFTKQWASGKTTYYGIPKTPGKHIARKHETYNAGGLITGASYIPQYRLVVLCGYDYAGGRSLTALHPFIILLYDFQGNNFFSGNKRRLDFKTMSKSQVEAIATSNALDYFITNEHFTTTQLGITLDLPARLQRINLRQYLLPYLRRFNKTNSPSSAD